MSIDNADSYTGKLFSELARGLDHWSNPVYRLADTQKLQLIEFICLLSKWNRIYNLTAVKAVEAMVSRHLLDSLALLAWLPEQALALADTTVDVMDIGSGAGLPVVPLAIARPDLQFLSVESNGKKTRFQQQALLELGLANVKVRQSRVQQVQDCRAAVITSRAFTAPANFLAFVEPLCLPGASVLVMLGMAERMPAQLPTPFCLEAVHSVDVFGSKSTRHIAICHKS